MIDTKHCSEGVLELVCNFKKLGDWKPVTWRYMDQNQSVSILIPNEDIRKYELDGKETCEGIPFVFGDKEYSSVAELRAKTISENIWCSNDCGIPDLVNIYRCCYGRTIMYIKEHFICYDRYDRLYDKRFTHYYYVYDNKKLSLLCYSDTAKVFSVFDDIEEIKYLHPRKMKEFPVFPFTIVDK